MFWHSSAHILGEAMERHYGGCLCYGPPIEGGYYYDMFLEGEQVAPSDFGNLESLFKSIVKEKQPFIRLEMKKEDLLEMFKVCLVIVIVMRLTWTVPNLVHVNLQYNKFKCRILNERVTTPTTTVYR